MFKFFFKVRNSFKWIRVIELASIGDDESALAELNSMNLDNLGILSVDYEVMKTTLLYGLNASSASDCSASIALKKISDSKVYNDVEKRYLEAFVRWSMCEENDLKTKKMNDLISSIDLKLVSKRLKEIFPLRCHSLWIE